jgi:ankyrin repeat protein
MIKNATVQLPEIQVVKTAQCFWLQACDSAHTAREAMETLHGNLMETEAAMETQAAPAFFLAALDGDAETVSKMLSTAGAQSFINYQHALGDTPLLTALGATPLLAAAANGHVAVTEQLLEARCNVDLQMQHGVSPLHCAAAKGHASVTKQLIVARCNIDLQKNAGVANQLIEARCSIDVPNVHGMTALNAAERMGHTTS